MIQFLLRITLLFLISACGQQPVANQKTLNNVIEVKNSKDLKGQAIAPKMDMQKCVCVQLWLPVCGDNGKTYSNACFADCAGVKYQQGSCSKTITD
ncbi:MAG: Kazal-type serine protease inhibitor family protein [Bacteriovorax sp.]|nr:Kazal-type serine protease inhibitor family protein [Bacteriovorax sp.]